MTHRIAVYGTLRKGQGRHQHFLQDSKFIKETRIPGHIYHLGGFPGYRCEDFGHDDSVICEIYEVSDETLQRIDRLEGVGYGMYDRIKAPGQENVFIYEWTYAPPWKDLIKSGDWVNQ